MGTTETKGKKRCKESITPKISRIWRGRKTIREVLPGKTTSLKIRDDTEMLRANMILGLTLTMQKDSIISKNSLSKSLRMFSTSES